MLLESSFLQFESSLLMQKNVKRRTRFEGLEKHCDLRNVSDNPNLSEDFVVNMYVRCVLSEGPVELLL